MVEVTSTDLLHHRISGSPTLTNGKEARALLDAAFAEIESSNGPRRSLTPSRCRWAASPTAIASSSA